MGEDVKRHWLFGAAALLLPPAPALADHPAAAGISSGPASLNVLSPQTLDRGALSAGFRLTYARPERRSDEELETLAGQHIHAHAGDYVLLGSAGLGYGLSDRLTLSAELPLIRRGDIREGAHSHSGGQAHNDVVNRGGVSGIGDISLLARFRLTGGDADAPALALIGGVKAPTGSTNRRDGDGERFETEHQPGSGSWDFISGAAFGAPLGALRLDASAVYHHSGTGAQRTRLGDRFHGGIALSHRFGPAADHHEAPADHHHDGCGGDHHHDDAPPPHGHRSWDVFVELTGEYEGRQRIAGAVEAESGGTAVFLSPGVRFNAASGFSVAAGIGIPVWQDIRLSHPDNSYRLTLSIGRAF
jgi:hypothetical protein